ncbi:ferrous iron transport protein B [Methanocaldococcus villosus KIN24-T80]|uniref:Ferrous iron transport protein B n=1 Tax=Methanocaldococcus villosus KIN24-T80 TaxID=1069083 RepID=N6VQT8_9EURY|nr:ferrous iron transport protein B [Methanocaldococcus villosus]ENN96265.1 ferrous iron transport protein B [Methanocaldococcus villosus KIN24-T80]
MRIALIGNPNVGKSTLFNLLTGGRVYVGNWPGVTVEKKEGVFICGDEKIEIIDLPGVYNLSGSAMDEIVVKKYFLTEKPDLIVNIADINTLDRDLYLTLELLDTGYNVLLVLNKIDSTNVIVDEKKLKELLGIDVVKISAKKNIGIENLKKKILENLKNKRKPKIRYNKEIEDIINKIIEILKRDENLKNYNLRFLAVKLLENDQIVKEIVKNSKVSKDIEELLKNIKVDISKERYKIIDKIVKECIKREEKRDITDLLDRIFTHEVYGILALIPIVWILFKITFDFAQPFVDIIDYFISYLADYASKSISDKVLASLVADGIIGGVGSVLTFLPNIAFLFISLSILGETGLLARLPLLTEKILNKFGLPGLAILPIIMSFGCNVPGILATRIIENERDRLVTILINPFITCPARLPALIILSALLFPKNPGLVLLLMYFVGIAAALFSALLFRKAIFKDQPEPLIIELPKYHFPNIKMALKNAWENIYSFIRKAGTVILFGSILIWFLSSFGPSGYVSDISLSYSAIIGKYLSYIFQIFGWDWKLSSALLYGFIAKENVVSTLAILYGVGEESLKATLSTLPKASLLSYMVFFTLYIPCLATIAVIKQEAGWKWAIFSVIYSTFVAFIAALIVYILGIIIL